MDRGPAREHFIGSTQERRQIHDVTVGLSDDDRILGLETSFLHDSGACPYGLIIPVITAAAPRPVQTRELPVRLHGAVHEHRSDLDLLPRGAGRPHAAFVMERVMDRAARELGLDRAEIRRRSLIQPDEFPYDVGVTYQDGGPTVYDSGDYPGGLELLLREVGYDGFEARQQAAKEEGRDIGLGFACYVEGTGIGPYEGAAVDVQIDGSAVSTGLASQGQGHETILAQIVADDLGVPMERIQVTTGDTPVRLGRRHVREPHRGGHRQRGGEGLAHGAPPGETLAARMLEADPGISSSPTATCTWSARPAAASRSASCPRSPTRCATRTGPSRRRRPASPGSPTRNTTSRCRRTTPGLNAVEYYSPKSGVFGYGIHAAVVEIDPDTCEIRILDYVVMHDCGRIINPTIVEGPALRRLRPGPRRCLIPTSGSPTTRTASSRTPASWTS